jgi:hypothetical protein
MSLPIGWSRIAADQIAHASGRVRILKIIFRASGGGHMYVVSYKDRKDTWCRHPSKPDDLAEAITIAENYTKEKKS